ncbi:SDR family NAD(P)-dependent oxidoreductase, partial [Gammaproteobacteria bacterium]|nr:SDR family NAD(P)-dependent oxidoreductase [Gammaproteobacteria bacterium]
MDLKNNVALVTGGASGLGRGTVEYLVSKGAKVAILDINDDKAKEVVDLLGADNVSYFNTNVMEEESVQNAIDGIKETFGKLNFVPGIDVVGTVLESADERFSEGDNVVATGYKIGMAVHGGFGEIVHLPADWVLHLPENMEMFDAMSIGTAGITAAACVKKIIDSGVSKDLP